MKDYETIKTQTQDRLCIITLNRPAKYNAINDQMVKDLQTVFEELSLSRDIDVSILTGEGKAFMAGADIAKIIERTPEDNEAYNRGIIKAFQLLENMDKPVIAAINGFALGGGMELAIACTFRIASANSKFGLPEVGLGILPGAGGPGRLPKLVGKQQAMRLILTGEIIDAEEALRLGLVMKVVPPEKLMDEAREFAQKILRNAPLSVRLAKDALEVGMDLPLNRAIEYAERNLEILIRSEDMKEGMKAFLEKRKASFKGW